MTDWIYTILEWGVFFNTAPNCVPSNTFISFVCFPQTVQNPVIVILYILFISRLEFFFEVSPLNYLISQFYFWIVAFFRFYDKATSLPPLKLISSDCITIVFSFHFEMLSSLVIPLSIYHLIVFHALCWIRCYLCHFKNKCPFLCHCSPCVSANCLLMSKFGKSFDFY